MGAASFSPDYIAARARFRSSSMALGCELEEHLLDQTGPEGEDLSLDVCRLGEVTPKRAVVISSGMHGVEGLVGSAVQAALLEEHLGGWTPPGGGALLMLHGLNPFGFAHKRWVNEDNAQLNRNFLLQGQEYAGSPEAYALLDPLLNPRTPPSRLDPFLLRTGLLVARKGMRPLREAALAGQYDYPAGLFYGGSGPSWTQRTLASQLPRWVGQAERVVHIDIHTGMGDWGSHRILVDHAAEDQAFQALTRDFGERVRPRLGEQAPYAIRGGLGSWCQERLPSCRYDVLTVEMGTRSALEVLGALREENRAWHWAPDGHPSKQRARARLCEAFVPARMDWRDQAVAQAVGVVLRAMEVVLG